MKIKLPSPYYCPTCGRIPSTYFDIEARLYSLACRELTPEGKDLIHYQGEANTNILNAIVSWNEILDNDCREGILYKLVHRTPES